MSAHEAPEMEKRIFRAMFDFTFRRHALDQFQCQVPPIETTSGLSFRRLSERPTQSTSLFIAVAGFHQSESCGSLHGKIG